MKATPKVTWTFGGDSVPFRVLVNRPGFLKLQVINLESVRQMMQVDLHYAQSCKAGAARRVPLPDNWIEIPARTLKRGKAAVAAARELSTPSDKSRAGEGRRGKRRGNRKSSQPVSVVPISGRGGNRPSGKASGPRTPRKQKGRA